MAEEVVVAVLEVVESVVVDVLTEEVVLAVVVVTLEVEVVVKAKAVHRSSIAESGTSAIA